MALSLTEQEELELLELERQRAGAQPQSAPQQKPGLLKQAWETAKIPGQMAEQGFKEMAAFVPPAPEPTGNLPLDIARGLPNLARTTAVEGLGKISNDLVLHPLNAIGAGAGRLLEAAAPVGRGLAKLASKGSGAMPEALQAAAKDPLTIFKPGIEKANQIYGKLVGEVPVGPMSQGGERIANAFNRIKNAMQGTGTTAAASNRRIVDAGLELAQEGKLSPRLANTVRKSLDALYQSKSISDDFLNNARKILSGIEDQASNITKAKEIRRTAEMVDDLRNPFPKTKSGGTGQFRTVLTTLMPFLAPLTSPATQGAVAAGLGAATRAAPGLGPVAALLEAIQSISNRRRQNGRE